MQVDASKHSLSLVGLDRLMKIGCGQAAVRVAVIDGPIAPGWLRSLGHPIEVFPSSETRCKVPPGPGCVHGTAIASILAGDRSLGAPGICQGCTLLVRPIFLDTKSDSALVPPTSLGELATAIDECISANASVIGLSASTRHPVELRPSRLYDALDLALSRGIPVIAAAGNDGRVGPSCLTSHPAVLPVVGCDETGSLLAQSTLAASMSRRGLTAPAVVTSLMPDGHTSLLRGTSAAAAIVCGTLALLMSLVRGASAVAARDALVATGRRFRAKILPPLLQAFTAYTTLSHGQSEARYGT
jgi:hypothetical protein